MLRGPIGLIMCIGKWWDNGMSNDACGFVSIVVVRFYYSKGGNACTSSSLFLVVILVVLLDMFHPQCLSC